MVDTKVLKKRAASVSCLEDSGSSFLRNVATHLPYYNSPNQEEYNINYTIFDKVKEEWRGPVSE
jgi:hypothetical protein